MSLEYSQPYSVFTKSPTCSDGSAGDTLSVCDFIIGIPPSLIPAFN